MKADGWNDLWKKDVRRRREYILEAEAETKAEVEAPEAEAALFPAASTSLCRTDKKNLSVTGNFEVSGWLFWELLVAAGLLEPDHSPFRPDEDFRGFASIPFDLRQRSPLRPPRSPPFSMRALERGSGVGALRT